MKTFNEDQLINLIQSLGKVGGGALAAYGAETQNLWTAGVGLVVAFVAWWCSHHSNATPATGTTVTTTTTPAPTTTTTP